MPILADLNHTNCTVIAWLLLLGGERSYSYYLRRLTGENKENSVNQLIDSPSGRQAVQHWRDFHPEISEEEFNQRIHNAVEDAYKARETDRSGKKKRRLAKRRELEAETEAMEAEEAKAKAMATEAKKSQQTATNSNKPQETAAETTTETAAETTAEPIITITEEKEVTEFNDEQVVRENNRPTVIVLDADEVDSILCFMNKQLLAYIKGECESITEVAELTAIYKKLNEWWCKS